MTPDPQPAPRPPVGNWSEKLRWFAAEFLVVVTGVLVALAFNAWWGAREEADREEAYLRQIHAEIRRTEAELGEEIRASRDFFANASRLHGLFFTHVPPSDSIRPYWIIGHADPEPVLGTLRAIVSTGDLQLVRDDSVRAALVWLGDRAAYYDARLRKWENVIVGTFPTLSPPAFAARTVEWNERGRPPIPGTSATWSEAMEYMPAGVRRPSFFDPQANPFDDPGIYAAVVTYLLGQRNHLRNQERLLEDVRATRRVLEGTLE